MLYQSLSRNNLHLCGDRDPRTKAPLQPAFHLTLSRFALVFYPLPVRLNEKMNCVSWIMVINQKIIKLQSRTKVLGQFAFLGRFPTHTWPTTPFNHKQCWTRVSRIFFRVSTLYRVGGKRTARKFRKDAPFRGNRETTEEYEYCSTVPRTFVHDCR